MKALFYILIPATIMVSSCATGGLYLGGEYDDLYYSPSDKPVVNVQNNIAGQNIARNIQPDQYYDNIYSSDTLIADQYNDAVDFNSSMDYNKDNSAFEYMDDWSYSNRLRRFYGNYFDPYWRDPFYYSWGYPSISFGFNYGYGYPYFGNGFYNSFYNPFMYDYYYGGYYGGYYSSFYNPYYYYGGMGYYPGYSYRYNDNSSVPVGRRERYSTYTNNYNSLSPSRKGTYSSSSGISGESRRFQPGSQGVTSESRRGESNLTNSRQSISTSATTSQTYQPRRDGSSVMSNSASTRPDYKSSNRTYTPSYNNPRMSTRPSYNNSRVSSGANNSGVQNTNRGNSNVNVYRSNPGNFNGIDRSNSSISHGQNRTTTTPARSGSYSTPTRRMDSGSGYSGGSYNNSSSGGSRSSTSSSFSSGSSSRGSSGSSSGSSSSGGSRRR